MDDLARADGDALPATPAPCALKPWGFWSTLGLSLVVVLAPLPVQTTVIIFYAGAQAGPDRVQELAGDGLFLSLLGSSSLAESSSAWHE